MMVQTSTHMGISVSMHGWAILLGYRTIVRLHHLPLPHLPTNVHHLFLIYLPMFIIFICCSAIPENPASRCFLMATILRGTPWPSQGHRGPIFQRCRKVKLKVRNRHCQATTRQTLRADFFALAIALLKIECPDELSLQSLWHPHHAWFTALQGTHGIPWSNQVRFDSDSFPIGVDNHASYC
jgi:hypothetical protein